MVTSSRSTLSPRESLEFLYHHLGGSNWTRQDKWRTNEPVSQWCGVTCNASGDITALELSQNNLKGRLDEQLVDALPRSIQQLWLSENQLEGNLPGVLADTGVFPFLCILDVGSNRLKGRLHPNLTRATHFNWFDITGNELTSYFRFTTETPVLPVPNSSSPLPHVHVVENLLSRESCQELLLWALDYAQQEQGGWRTDRHKEYPTTDMDVAIVGGQLLDRCNDHLKRIVLPMLARLFDLPIADLAMEDWFLAKYAHDEQTGLPMHRDGSELSLVIPLNDPTSDYEGGGTLFWPGNVQVKPTTPGTGVLFCGRLCHAGMPVTKGTRYILAGFVRVYPSSVESGERLQQILEACQSIEPNEIR